MTGVKEERNGTAVMSISKEIVTVISQEQIAADIYSMWFESSSIASRAGAGQFVSVYCDDGAHLLPRPISICEIDRRNGRIRLVYRIAGYGTRSFSEKKAGDRLTVMGPLGNGYSIAQEQCEPDSRVLLVAGGIGIPPMLQLAKDLPGEKTIVLGYKDELFLQKAFAQYGRVVIATEDGSCGVPGNVLDAIRQQELTGDMICSCGPTPMLRAVKAFAQEKAIPAWISLEERMACGVGACLGCVCKSTEIDSHSHVHNKRVCKDGPVLNAAEVEI